MGLAFTSCSRELDLAVLAVIFGSVMPVIMNFVVVVDDFVVLTVYGRTPSRFLRRFLQTTVKPKIKYWNTFFYLGSESALRVF